MNKAKGISYMLLAIGAVVGLALEFLLAYIIEPNIYHLQMTDWSTSNYIIHWIVTCIMWGIVGAIIVHYSKTRLNYDILKKGEKLKAYQCLLIILGIVLSAIVSYFSWDGFKVLKEFQNLGVLKFFFQYMYYAFEVMLFNLILIFGQKACEIWFRKTTFPYGGVIVALTWGIGHFISKDFITGILSVVIGFVFGATYLLTNRDVKKTYIATFLMFAL